MVQFAAAVLLNQLYLYVIAAVEDFARDKITDYDSISRLELRTKSE